MPAAIYLLVTLLAPWAAALALAQYRNKGAVFDPERQSALQLQQVSKLQDELMVESGHHVSAAVASTVLTVFHARGLPV